MGHDPPDFGVDGGAVGNRLCHRCDAKADDSKKQCESCSYLALDSHSDTFQNWILTCDPLTGVYRRLMSRAILRENAHQ